MPFPTEGHPEEAKEIRGRDAIMRRYGLAGMADYESPLIRRQMASNGHAGQGEALGPVADVVYPAPSEPTQQQMDNARNHILADLPFQIAMELRRQLMLPSREAIWFARTGQVQALAAGATATVITVTMQQRQTGALEYIGTNILPIGSAANVAWSILVSTQVGHPFINQQVMLANTLGNPYKFRMELIQSQTISLQATNNGPGAVDVQGVLIGWEEYMSDDKQFGSSSASGVG